MEDALKGMHAVIMVVMGLCVAIVLTRHHSAVRILEIARQVREAPPYDLRFVPGTPLRFPWFSAADRVVAPDAV